MKKSFINSLMMAAIFLTAVSSSYAGAVSWPKQINTTNAKIILYQPQPDSLQGNHLYGRAAVSVTPTGKDPVFGAVWIDAVLSIDRTDRTYLLVSTRIPNVRFPGQDNIDKSKIDNLKKLLETEIPKWEIQGSMDELLTSLKANESAEKVSENLNNDPPEIIFVKKTSVLVLFDGEPVFKDIENSSLKRAINTPFLVLQDPKEKTYYLYGSDMWFRTNDVVAGTWVATGEVPRDAKKIQDEIEKEAARNKSNQQKTTGAAASGNTGPQGKPQKSVVPDIIIRTKPAELLQSDGEPNFVPITGTQLLYVKNTDDNIFMYIADQNYYVLISGRWFSSKKMEGPWNFIEPDKVPAEFSKIPEGSEKDIVLASVPGTPAAKEAVLDAQIPQTAAVDRKEAKCTVKYDGDPKFEQIKGTILYRAVNTSSTVILSNKAYYVCENAIWFIGNTPTGPWAVATEIPAEVQKIPPDDPAYNVKYVYIYDVTPEVVYVGYTPGYVGCYVYGPTVVYGTGFVYPPFYGPYYYPRPVTYGFCMTYNPWMGWSMGFSVSSGFVTFGVSFGAPMYHGGWWGPPMYHPPYYPPCNHYYGGGNVYVRNTTINVNNTYNATGARTNNIYNNQGNAVRSNPNGSTRPSTGDMNRSTGGNAGKTPSTQPASRQGGNTPSTQPASRDAGGNRAGTAPNARNNVYTDKSGNVYRNNNGNWEQNNGKNWEPAGGNAQQGNRQAPASNQARQQPQQQNFDRQQMDRQNADRQRATQRQTTNSSFNRSAGSYGGGGGGARGGGGGGRR
jgi:hypothetical protein